MPPLPSEKKVVLDPVTGIPLMFLTSTPAGDSKIYQTHPQWTADGKWLVFRSNRVAGQAFAVNGYSSAILQLTENGYVGMLCVARFSMKLHLMRSPNSGRGRDNAGADHALKAATAAQVQAYGLRFIRLISSLNLGSAQSCPDTGSIGM